MNSEIRHFVYNNVKLPINASQKEAFSIAKAAMLRCGVRRADVCFSIFRRSIDARKRVDIKFVYSVLASAAFSAKESGMLSKAGFTELKKQDKPSITPGTVNMDAPPLVVGSGPCGLFCALVLAENGYNPILIERGGSVEERKCAVSRFNTFGILDPDTNIQFGAGGAGTFSDGKLVTRINDPLCAYVMDRFVEFGAPEDIRYIAKPHIGTDVLSGIIDKICDRIVSLGGAVHFHTRLIDFKESGGHTVAKTTVGDFNCSAIVLAIGHSARDTYSGILQKGMAVEAKPISVGMRIEHLADDIDKALYGDNAGNALLGRAEYNLSHNTHERGVYTFCMCPGGEVVAAASEEGGVVVNGMSRHSRAGVNSNSAVVCSIFPTDYGNTPERAIAFQREIESRAFKAGGGDYTAPAVTVGDFLCDKAITEPYRVFPSYMESGKIKIASPREYLPEFTVNAIKAALVGFDRSISGFASESAVLTGAETRTSAPLRILRDPETRLARGYSSVYPAGEGAGYAGGITSAAIDGIKTAIAIIEKYKPNI